MSHRVYYATHTHRQIQGLFRQALAPGGFKDEASTERVFNLKVDGTRIGGRKPRLHKPYSNVYSKEEFESLAVARMLVQLNLDAEVLNILERDRPDIEMLFSGIAFLSRYES